LRSLPKAKRGYGDTRGYLGALVDGVEHEEAELVVGEGPRGHQQPLCRMDEGHGTGGGTSDCRGSTGGKRPFAAGKGTEVKGGEE